jgi:hypothetical protein
MSNPNAHFGLARWARPTASPIRARLALIPFRAGDGTAVYIGDAVKLVGTSQIINGSPYADIAIAATGDVFVGVVIGVLPSTRDSLTYRAASTQRLLLVADDPDLLFEVQQRNSGTAAQRQRHRPQRQHPGGRRLDRHRLLRDGRGQPARRRPTRSI